MSAMKTSSQLIVSRRNYLSGLAMAIAGAVLFSAKAIVAKLLYRYQLDAVTLIAFRMAFSLPVFAVIAMMQMRQPLRLSTGEKWRLLLVGLTGYYLSSFLDFLGLQYISAGLERLILFLTPSFVLFFSMILYQRQVTRLELGALLLSYSGIVLVFLHDLHWGADNVVLGAALVLGAAVSYAAYLMQSGQLLARLGTLRLVSYAMCIASVACITQCLAIRPISVWNQPDAVIYLSLFNALFCTVFPVFLTMMAIKRIGAATASQAGMIGPVSTLFLGAWLLAEPVTGWQLLGTALVLSGMYLLSTKK
ncbi:MAG: DMT family transporter [Undibacterium curvum]|uniref:DMT family transporter n=1 Tax=Undibacterium curvum TaxID=2762294 RepID=UPI003BDFA991